MEVLMLPNWRHLTVLLKFKGQLLRVLCKWQRELSKFLLWSISEQFVFMDCKLHPYTLWTAYISCTKSKIHSPPLLFHSLNGIECMGLRLGWQLFTLALTVEFIHVPLVIQTFKIIKYISLSKMHGSLLWITVANVFSNNLLKLFIVLSMQKHNVLENFIWRNLYNIGWSAN